MKYNPPNKKLKFTNSKLRKAVEKLLKNNPIQTVPIIIDGLKMLYSDPTTDELDLFQSLGFPKSLNNLLPSIINYIQLRNTKQIVITEKGGKTHIPFLLDEVENGIASIITTLDSGQIDQFWIDGKQINNVRRRDRNNPNMHKSPCPRPRHQNPPGKSLNKMLDK